VSGIVDGIPEGFEAYFAASERLASALKDCWIVEWRERLLLMLHPGQVVAR
jgi:hypothetical protein